MKVHFAFGALAISLTACGGTSTPTPVSVTPGAEDIGRDLLTLTLSGAETQIILDSADGAIAIPIDDLGRQGTLRAGFVIAGLSLGGAYLSEGDASRAGVAIYGFNGETPDEVISHGGFYERTAASTIPTTGSADLEGAYASFLVDPDTGVTIDFAAIVGDLSLNADFGAGTVSGTIEDRVLIDVQGYDEIPMSDLPDLTLAETAIGNAGEFAGATSGGDLNVNGFEVVSTTGTYGGLFAGDNATESVGTVQIRHVGTDETFDEIGVFAAGH